MSANKWSMPAPGLGAGHEDTKRAIRLLEFLTGLKWWWRRSGTVAVDIQKEKFHQVEQHRSIHPSTVSGVVAKRYPVLLGHVESLPNIFSLDQDRVGHTVWKYMTMRCTPENLHTLEQLVTTACSRKNLLVRVVQDQDNPSKVEIDAAACDQNVEGQVLKCIVQNMYPYVYDILLEYIP